MRFGSATARQTIAAAACTAALVVTTPAQETSPPAAAVPQAIRLTVEETVQRAQQNSPRLSRLRALEDAAEAAEKGTHTERRPDVSLLAAYSYRSHVPEFTAPAPGGGTQVIFPDIVNTYRTRLDVRFPLYNGGLNRDVEAAEHDRLAASHDITSGTGDTALEARASYWNVVAAREEERVLREAIASFDAHLKETRDREAVGLAARNDVLLVQVDRDQAELDRLRAENAAAIANADLVRLLGLQPGTRVETADTLASPPLPPGEMEALVSQAFEARPERRALKERVAAAEARARAAHTGNAPQLTLAGGYDYSNPNARILPLTATWQDTWDIGVNFTWTLIDAGRTSAAFAQASAEESAASAALEDLERNIRLEVTSRFLDLGSAAAAVGVADRNLESATENVRVSSDRYREGVLASADRLDAETGLLRAGLERVRALTQEQLAAAALQHAVGR
jgi:outer membrane protein TolC